MNNNFRSTSFTRTARSGFGDFKNLQMEIAEIESKPGTSMPGARASSQPRVEQPVAESEPA
eukprot:CAMPEP_0185604444 /NCGR_PEP_ID=MMETSP0436-20130131/3302_1 /TAXON_ID=626734 ORGANISM="Favella taraikaensis, Strain Fe Narragansett Bay" /NCGR_SAMPLE_ID=MMETSP0436 /ASSEMBLY_ACC=CAM_ASM_000390 /LENGTH=60 /DNA_ID=CAMNT_0028235303 /DNA_START=481 /DNA_END=663 /DNA_ORIENTATION=+